MPSTNRVGASGRPIVNRPPISPSGIPMLKLGKFTTNAPGLEVKSHRLQSGPNSPVKVTITRVVRPYTQSGKLSVTLNGHNVSVSVGPKDSARTIAQKLEKALEKANPLLDVKVKPPASWVDNPVGLSKTELVVDFKANI